MINAIIIDDEQECINDLKYLITKHKLPVEIIATATNGNEALVQILRHKPQLIFLDVVMPGMSGFEMLELLPSIDFQLIITTSMDKYAVQAIRSSALDFLLKPIKVSELQDAIARANEKNQHPTRSQLNLLQDTLKTNNQSIRKIALNNADGVELVSVDDILYFESDGNYTVVHLKGNKTILVTKQIGKFEEVVSNSGFFRIHNSYIVNLNYIRKFVRSDGGHIVLENGKALSISRSRKDQFLELLSNL